MKRGQIFDAKAQGIYFTKSPQAIVLEDRVRIYFTACKKDGEKLISYPAYVDYDLELKKILKVGSEILSKGNIGCFDEHGIFPFSPLKGENGIVYAYTSGITRRVSVSVDSGIGLAISKDGGDTFARFGQGPILTSSLFEPFLVIDGQVRIYNSVWHMWYIYGTDWTTFIEGNEPDRTYVIGHATSDDGIEWIKENKAIIPTKILFESQALPSVIKNNDEYLMIFCWRYSSDFRNNRNRSYKLGCATSKNLSEWNRNDYLLKGLELGKEGEWDSEMMCYPNLFSINDKTYLLYNGNEFGKYGFGLAELINE